MRGDVLATFEVEKLCPRFDEQHALGIACDVFHQDVFVVLRRIGTHLQPQQARGIADFAAAENDVAVVYRLAAACQTAVAEAVRAVFYDNVGVAAVIGVLIRPGPLPPFSATASSLTDI